MCTTRDAPCQGGKSIRRCLATPRSHDTRARSTNRTCRPSPDSAPRSCHIAFLLRLVGSPPWALRGCNLHFRPAFSGSAVLLLQGLGWPCPPASDGTDASSPSCPPNAPRPRNPRPSGALARTARTAMRMPCASCDALPRYWRPAIPRWRSAFARGTRDAPCPVRGNGRRLCPAEKQRKEIPLGLPGPAIEVGREPIPPKTKGGRPCGPPPSGCAL